MAAVGGVGQFVAGKSAEVAVPEFVAALMRAYSRLVEAERKLSGCIELPAVLKPQPAEVLVVVPVESVAEARLVVQAAVPRVV